MIGNGVEEGVIATERLKPAKLGGNANGVKGLKKGLSRLSD